MEKKYVNIVRQRLGIFQKEWNGYVVVPNAVAQDHLDAASEATFDFLGMAPDRPKDWYCALLRTNGMTEMYHHRAMWDNRQHPRMHQIFSEI